MALYLGTTKITPTFNVGEPSGVLQITTNGTYNVASYASAEVNVQTPQPSNKYYIEREIVGNTLSLPTYNIQLSLPDSITAIGNYVLGYAYQQCNFIISVDFSNVTSVGSYAMERTFSGCGQLTSINFDSLQNAADFAFSYCFSGTRLTNVVFPELLTTGSNTFLYAFTASTTLTSISFPKLNSVGNSCFSYAFFQSGNINSISFGGLKSNSFGSYTNCFSRMLYNISGCTVHFPSNLQSVIGSWTDVVNGFNGTNTVVLFDLPATE